MCFTLAALLLPAVRGVHLDWNYDALYSLKSTYQAPIGTAMVERHWPIGEIAPIDILVVADRSWPIEAWKSACDKITAAILAVADVDNVRALTMPLGVHAPPRKMRRCCCWRTIRLIRNSSAPTNARCGCRRF